MYVTKTVQIFVKDLWLAAVKTLDFKQRSQQHRNKNMFFQLWASHYSKKQYQSIPVSVEVQVVPELYSIYFK